MSSLIDAALGFWKKVNAAKSTGQKEPITCPCCEHQYRVYKRGISGKTALDFMRFYKVNGTSPGHITSVSGIGGGDFGKLRFWDLITAIDDEKRGGKTSGYWSVTPFGVAVIKGYVYIERYKHIFNNEVVGESGGAISLRDRFPEKFDYEELMNR